MLSVATEDRDLWQRSLHEPSHAEAGQTVVSAPVPIRLFRDVQRSAVKLDRVPESQAIVFDVRNFKDPAAGNLKHHDGRHDEIIDRIRCLPQASGKYVQGGCWLPGASCEAAQRLPELGGQPAHPDCPGVAAFRPLDRAELCQASENFGNSGQFKAWLHVSFQPQDRPPSRLCFTASLDATAPWPLEPCSSTSSSTRGSETCRKVHSFA